VTEATVPWEDATPSSQGRTPHPGRQHDRGTPGNRRRPGHVAQPSAPRVAPYVFVAPAVVLLVAVLLIPIGYTLYLSFQKSQVSGLGLGAGARRQVFAGLSNYSTGLTDPAFLSSLLRVVVYSLILVPVMLGLALLFALLLDAQRVRLQRFSRLSIFLPYAVPIVIASLLWGFMYLPTLSPFPAILATVGLSMPNLFTTHVALLSVANIGVWGGTGFNMIVLYTALRAVPSELYEAARIDGASQVQVSLRIKIPMIAPALVLTGVFSIIATLQVFNEPQTLSPLTNTISPDWMPLMRIYDLAFNENNSYEAAALSMIIAAVMFAGSYALLRVTSKHVFQER
jgi:multiple sugar transport system permease protein